MGGFRLWYSGSNDLRYTKKGAYQSMDPSQQPQQPVVPTYDPTQPPAPVAPTPQPQAFQPVAPVTPAPVAPAPQPIVPAGAPAPAWNPAAPQPVQPAAFTPPSKGLNKKLIIIIACAVGGLVIVGVVIAVLIAVFSVSKKDYNAALDQYNELSSANYTLSSKVSTVTFGVDSSTDTTFDNDMDAAKKALDTVKSENAALAKLKAANIGESGAKYKAFNTKLEAYITHSTNLLSSLGDVRDAMLTCDKAGESSASTMIAAIDTCVTDLGKVSNVADADVKEYIGKIKTEFTSLSSIFGQLSKITDPYGKQYDQYKSLRDQTYAVSDNLSNARSDFHSNLEKHSDAVDPKDAADDFSKFLESKLTN